MDDNQDEVVIESNKPTMHNSIVMSAKLSEPVSPKKDESLSTSN